MSYTYLIGWSSLNKYYYGVRFARHCRPEELWKTYFTSSRHVTEFRVRHGEPDIIQVRRVFSDSESARRWETKVLTRMKAHMDDRFLNKTNNKAIQNTSAHYKKLGDKLRGAAPHPNAVAAARDQYTKHPERRQLSRLKLQTFGNQGVYAITFPDGTVENVTHLKTFCERHNVSYTSMSSLANGKYPCETYKGFKARKLGTVVMIRNH